MLVDTLLDGRYEDERQGREYLELVAKENVRLSRLIDNFLTFSRMERNKQALDLADVDPREAVDEAADAVADRIDSAGGTLTVDAEADLPMLRADRDALVTVLVNLLDNAYKYTEGDRDIVLRAYTLDGQVCFAVEDNGIGIPRRAQRRVFDRFYQIDRSLTRPTGGCGLGLSIVAFLVEAHAGTVDVTSQPGQGSTFTVRLPCDAPARSGV